MLEIAANQAYNLILNILSNFNMVEQIENGAGHFKNVNKENREHNHHAIEQSKKE